MPTLNTAVLDHMSLPCTILDRNLCFVYANEAYRVATRQIGVKLLGRHLFDIFPDTPERMELVRTKFEATLAGETTQLEAQPFQITSPDGTSREIIWQTTQDPIRDASGEITHMIVQAEDITAQTETEQRNRAMTIEINHRVKNMMSVITAIARITSRTATDLSSFTQGFTDRIAAMARAHDRLAHDRWQGLDVREILELELVPYCERTGAQYTLTGPKVKLSIAGTKDFAMVVHELLTNATKYGCFSPEGGALNVSWRDSEDGLLINWTETAHCAVVSPTRTGFGSRLFDMLPSVSVTRDFPPTGLNLSILIAKGDAFDD